MSGARIVTFAAIQAAPEETRQWLADVRGLENERRALAALREYSSAHPDHWLRGAREKTREEDLAGADLVVQTDAGELWLQVKSSHAGRRRFVAHSDRAPRPIAVVVVADADDAGHIAEKVLKELEKLRAAQVAYCPKCDGFGKVEERE